METAIPMLQPVVALVMWSMVMWAWMYVTRVPATLAMKMKLDPELPKDWDFREPPPQTDQFLNLTECNPNPITRGSA